MRVAERFLVAALCMMLIFGVIGALSGSRADIPERGTAFHKPHYPSAIEPVPVSTSTSFTDQSIAAPVAGFVLHVNLSARAASWRTRLAIDPTPETALNQRPPPRTLFIA
jgi:hypothetical protein